MKTNDFDEILSDFSRFYILTILYEGPHHGYKIISKFRKRLKKNITPSLVYPFLQSLEENGLTKYTIKAMGKKEKKVYELTEKGKTLCTQLFKRFSSIVATAIEPSLSICAHCGSKVYEGGHLEQINGKEIMFCCKYCAASCKQEKDERNSQTKKVGYART
jgi:DNA-binding PadR family transcriptional regulator